MKLMTAAQRKALVKQAEVKPAEPIVHLKFFGLGRLGSWTWYATEYEPGEQPGEGVFFGLVTSSLCPEGELGYFSEAEIAPMMLSSSIMKGAWIERDLHWTPKPLSVVQGQSEVQAACQEG